ncbi:MAG TPA: cytochrome D1 domain-containing protein [Pyrinomonadaceae bacterium]|nr:cytochrome D1 domain-containing protein [Pyrinomonadaceae bacterium]
MNITRPALRLAALSLALGVSLQTSGQDRSAPQRVTREGVQVEFHIEPVAQGAELTEGQDALVRFRITDTATKNPVAGVRPSAWIDVNKGQQTSDPKVCREKISAYLQGSLRARPDLDLNTFYVLALNQEANISVIDPLLGFGGSKLLTLVMLKSPGEDWALTRDRATLFVSLPSAGQVAAVDTATWKVKAYVDAGARPTRLALQPDGKYLWVADDADGERAGGVTVVDASTLKPAARIQTGAGRHELAFTGDSRFAFVTNKRDSTLSVVEVARLSKVADVPTAASPSSLAYSPLGQAVYVAGEAGGGVTVVDARTHRAVKTIAARPGLHTLRVEPKGRFGFVTNPKENLVHVFDASTNSLVHSIPVGKEPDQISFTDAFAYVRSAGTEEVALIRLSTVGKEPDVSKFPGGNLAPAHARAPSLADSFSPAPGGSSMLVANAPDGVIYYYSEGMAAPMGNFQNYKRQPKSVLVVDRSLREESPGVFTTNVKLPAGGKYDVSFLLDSPRVTHCFEASARLDPALKNKAARDAVKLQYLVEKRTVTTGEPFTLRFKLTDAATGRPKDGLADVRVLTFLTPGVWQKRDFAREVGGGVYEVEIKAPEPGYYMVFVESRALGTTFRDLPSLGLQAAAPPAGQTP